LTYTFDKLSYYALAQYMFCQPAVEPPTDPHRATPQRLKVQPSALKPISAAFSSLQTCATNKLTRDVGERKKTIQTITYVICGHMEYWPPFAAW
jgi:hypothetical protein